LFAYLSSLLFLEFYYGQKTIHVAPSNEIRDAETGENYQIDLLLKYFRRDPRIF